MAFSASSHASANALKPLTYGGFFNFKNKINFHRKEYPVMNIPIKEFKTVKNSNDIAEVMRGVYALLNEEDTHKRFST